MSGVLAALIATAPDNVVVTLVSPAGGIFGFLTPGYGSITPSSAVGKPVAISLESARPQAKRWRRMPPLRSTSSTERSNQIRRALTLRPRRSRVRRSWVRRTVFVWLRRRLGLRPYQTQIQEIHLRARVEEQLPNVGPLGAKLLPCFR